MELISCFRSFALAFPFVWKALLQSIAELSSLVTLPTQESFLTVLYNAFPCQMHRFYKQCLESFWLLPYINEVLEGNIPLKWNSEKEINKGIVYKDIGG